MPVTLPGGCCGDGDNVGMCVHVCVRGVWRLGSASERTTLGVVRAFSIHPLRINFIEKKNFFALCSLGATILSPPNHERMPTPGPGIVSLQSRQVAPVMPTKRGAPSKR